MAVQGIQPFIHLSDSNGNPIVGATLTVYDAGTTNLRAIYSDSGLSVSLTNPLSGVNASDSSGKFPRFYMAAGTYKLVAATSAGVPLWTYDNIDTGLSAGIGALPITGGGTGATTAAAARANLDVPANSDVTALSTTIATLSAAIQNIVSIPQGRLTMTSATPVLVTGVTAGTAVYYTPFIGNLCPIYDGTQFNATVFAELTLTLNANHLASAIYDCFVINDSGTVRVVTGPAWNTATAGAGARGSGAGTTDLVRTNGIWTNTNSMTARNGATTYTVAANRGTYVGSIFMDGTNGQLTCNVAYGQSRKFGVWNAYNRVPLTLKAGDGTSSWSYTGAIRASNSSAANSLTIFSGLPEELFDLVFQQNATSGTSITTNASIGFNSTSAASGKVGSLTNITANSNLIANYLAPPSIGINTITALETSSAGSSTFSGTEASMVLSAMWRG